MRIRPHLVGLAVLLALTGLPTALLVTPADAVAGASLPHAGLWATLSVTLEVLYGRAGIGLQASSPDDQVWSQDTVGVMDAAAPLDGFGWKGA